MTPQLKITHHPEIGWAYHFDTDRETIIDLGFFTRWGATRAGKKAIREHLQRKDAQQ